jgi:hypothetical protein
LKGITPPFLLARLRSSLDEKVLGSVSQLDLFSPEDESIDIVVFTRRMNLLVARKDVIAQCNEHYIHWCVLISEHDDSPLWFGAKQN